MVDVFTRSNLTLVATLVMRDEEDVLKPMIEHHLEEGVSRFFVTDNGSRDRSVEIASRYREVELSRSDDMTHNQEKHVTAMAREAAKCRPDWVVHTDADEFWCDLRRIADATSLTAAYVLRSYVHPPVSGIPDGRAPLRRMRHYVDFLGNAPEFKVMHRPSESVVVAHGNHHCTGAGEVGYFHGVYRHHYPVRSYAQFERKVVQGTTAMKARGVVCQRWYGWYDEYASGNLRATYDAMASSWEDVVANGVHAGALPALLANYKVSPEVVARITEATGVVAEVGSWVPPTFGKGLPF